MVENAFLDKKNKIGLRKFVCLPKNFTQGASKEQAGRRNQIAWIGSLYHLSIVSS
jgi:hypothetical protein